MVESNPIVENRAYRKTLASTGLIFLGAVEHKINVLNISLSGLLAELKYDGLVHDVKDMFQALRVSPVIDIYLPEMRVAGEAEVVRVESTEHGFHIGIEFRNLSYDIDSLLYGRRAYRKNMTAPGSMVFNGFEYEFNTENVSVDGLMIRISGCVEIVTGTAVPFAFNHLELRGEGQVIWVEHDQESTLIGLRYLRMERDDIKGIPRFVRPELPAG